MPVPQPWYQAGTGNKPRPPLPLSFWNVDSGPRIPNAPQSPTTLSALQSDVSCRASGSDYPPGRGLWWAQAVQPAPALGGWSLSSEEAQLLLALISCGDFLTVLETPGRLRLWELCWLGKDGLPLYPNRRHIPQTLKRPCLQNAGPTWDEGWGGQGSDISAAQSPTDCTTLSNSIPLSDPQFPHL